MRFCPAASAPPLLALILALLFLAPHSAMSAPPLPAGIANSGKLIIWNNSDGNGAVSLWDQVSPPYYTRYTCGPYPGWSALAVAAGSDQVPRILWTNTDGRAALWSVNPSNGSFTHADYGPYTGYTAVGLAVGGDNAPRVLWAKTDGTMSLWRVAPDTTFTHAEYGPFPGYTASLIAAGADSIPRILWTKSDGSISLWHDVQGAAGYSYQNYGPYSGYTAMSMAVDGNNTPRILWNHPSDGTTSLWSVAPGGSFTFQNVTLPASYVPVAVGTGLDAGSGGYAQVLYVQVGSLGNDGGINSFASNGSSRLATYAGPYAGDGTVLSAAGAGTGGGGGGTGGGTTATPNPHGQYVFNGYTGGTLTSSDGSASVTPPGPISSNNSIDAYPDAANVYGGSATFSGYHTASTNASVQLGGTIYASFKWQADAGYAGSPTPAQVTVIQRCTASWSMSGYTSGFSGQCNSGLSPAHGFVSGTYSDSASGIGSTGVVNNPGQGFTVSCSPSAIVNGFEGGTSYQCSYGTVNFAYTASAVTMSVAGTKPDANGIDNILVGQGATGNWNIPTPLQNNTTYAWKVSGTTFQDWEPTTPPIGTNPANSQASYFLGGFGDPTKSPAHWYWNDPNNTPETVSCTVSVTPPPGQGNQFSVTMTKSVKVQLPGWDGIGQGGYMQVNALVQNQSDVQLWAGPTSGMKTNGARGGMNWQCNVYTPTTPAFGTGSMELIQLVTPSSSYTTSLTPPVQTYTNPLTGVQGLDLTYPYGNVWPEASQPYNDNDTPGIHITQMAHGVAASAMFQSSYIDYLMYKPPGTDTQWITLGQFSWSTDGNATVPTTNAGATPPTAADWATYATRNGSDAAGTVTPGQAAVVKFNSIMGPAFYPSWKTIDRSISF